MCKVKENQTSFPGRKYLGSDYNRKRNDLLKDKVKEKTSKTHELKNFLFIPAVTFLGKFIGDESERPNASEGKNGDSKVLLGLWLRVLVMREIQTSKEAFSDRCLLLIYWHETGCHENLSPIWGGGEPNNDRANLDSTKIHLEELGSLLRLTSKSNEGFMGRSKGHLRENS